MDIKQYQILASRTIDKDAPREKNLNNYTYGLIGEFGEVVDYLKKVNFHEHPFNKEKLTEELGDCFWYIAAFNTEYREEFVIERYGKVLESEVILINTILMDISDFLRLKRKYPRFIIAGLLEIARRYEITLDEILEFNIHKLSVRYPEKFTTKDSIKRVDTKED